MSSFRQLLQKDSFPYVDAVIYINLEHRTDRRAQVEEELQKHFPPHKIHRLNAVYNPSFGHIGCSKSHIAALKLAEERKWNTVMVVEDDMQWTPEVYRGLRQIQRFNSPDVVLLHGTNIKFEETTQRVRYAQCATAYIVRGGYIPALRANFEEGLAALEKENPRLFNAAYVLDLYWCRLMEKDVWYIVVPPMATQRTSYSDNQGKIMN